MYLDWHRLAETLADTEGDLHNTAGHQVGAISGLATTGKHHSWAQGFTTAILSSTAIFLANSLDAPMGPIFVCADVLRSYFFVLVLLISYNKV